MPPLLVWYVSRRQGFRGYGKLFGFGYSIAPPCGLSEKRNICPRSPSRLWEIVKRRLVKPLHGWFYSPPAGSLPAAPIACDGSRTEISAVALGLWLGRSIIVLSPGRRLAGNHPAFSVGLCRSPRRIPAKFVTLRDHFGGLGAPSDGLAGKRMCLTFAGFDYGGTCPPRDFPCLSPNVKKRTFW